MRLTLPAGPADRAPRARSHGGGRRAGSEDLLVHGPAGGPPLALLGPAVLRLPLRRLLVRLQPLPRRQAASALAESHLHPGRGARRRVAGARRQRGDLRRRQNEVLVQPGRRVAGAAP